MSDKKIKENISNLRKIMRQNILDAYIVPHNDESLSEYVPVNKERLKWVCGFSGSAGSLIITASNLYLFTDGRYILQAKKQTRNIKCQVINISDSSVFEFLLLNNTKFKTVGIETKTISVSDYLNLKKLISNTNLNIKIINNNLLDRIWKRNLNVQNTNKIFFLSVKYTGESKRKKLFRVKKYLQEQNVDYIFTQDSESLAWLLNLRGQDLPNTPVIFCSAIIGKNKNAIFFESKNIPEKIKSKLKNNFSIHSTDEFNRVIREFCTKSSKIIIDNKKLSVFNYNLLKQVTKNIINKNDILLLYRSIKNKIEIQSSKKAHLYDGIAMCKFLFWYKNHSGELSELDVVEKVNKLRSQNKSFICASFPTIAGSAENGAIIHYQPNKLSSRKIKKSDILLLDSGGQYYYGTTDVTRTISRGKKVSKEIIFNYTIVLKSHINVNLSKFPSGTPCSFLDLVARKILWEVGEDFAHSTGHGVGFCLNVHEGPFAISSKNISPLNENMLFSNEPGIYKNGKYGIRIENLVSTRKIILNKKTFLALENHTFVPYDRELIDVSLLSLKEKNWLNNYHKNVIKKIGSKLNYKERVWLESQCKRI